MTMNRKGETRPEGQNISPAIAQHAANECVRLRGINAELVTLVKECVEAINQEFDALGDDWKDQPIMHAKNKTLKKARAILAKAQEGKS